MMNHLNEIKKSVAFICILTPGGSFIAIGTGFFVSISFESNEHTESYFVTAKHLLKINITEYHKEIYLRLNLHGGGVEHEKIDLNNVKLITHSDKDVDIAVFGCRPNNQKYDVFYIPQELIANNTLISQYNISEGDNVFFSGLFNSHVGKNSNQPIFRFGKVALISDEKIEWVEIGKDPIYVDIYLLECLSFNGNSGSPVFFDLSPARSPVELKPKKYFFLAGIMKGNFNQNDVKELLESNVKSLVLSQSQNIGIAAITPAQKLYDILFSDELEEARLKMRIYSKPEFRLSNIFSLHAFQWFQRKFDKFFRGE